MNCNLSRSQKSKANKLQKSILNVISEQSKLQHEYGEFYVYLDFVNKLEKQGICLFDDKKERAELLGMCLLGECLRKIAINHPQLFSHHSDDTPKDYNTDNIYIGQVVPNYRKLCELLEVEPKTGKSRQLQEKDFFRYFDYEKLKYSNEYVILDIYDTPLQKNEKSKNSLYCNALKLMIMYELSKELSEQKAKEHLIFNDDDIVYSIKTTYNSLIKKLELLSIFFDKDINDFLVDKYLQLTNQDITDIDKAHIIQNISIFKRIINKKHKVNIDYALKCLKDQNIVHFDAYNIIVEKIDGCKKKRRATFNEEVLITNAKREAAKELGYKNANTASLYKQKEYNEALETIYRNKYNWLYVYHEIKIGANIKMLSTPINEYTNYSVLDFSILNFPHNELDLYKRVYLNNVRNAVLKSNNEKCEKSKEKVYSNTDLELFDISPDTFINDIDNKLTLQRLFIDYFIDPDEELIADCNDYYST